MPQQYLHIELCPDYTLDFTIHNTPLADIWLKRMYLRDKYPLDHPDRFYGFNSQEHEIARSERIIQECISTINSYQPIIERKFSNANDQDGLNYLHNIFERYHGLLDKQDTEWWLAAPKQVQRALADLNIAVHRCETAYRDNHRRIVCTWYGLPKEGTLPEHLMQQYGDSCPPFGSVCLNYVEIGKTLSDLALDNDEYIGDDAFQPFNHYNADFVVRFFELTPERVEKKIAGMKEYYQKHYDFFSERGFTDFDHVKLQPLFFPVAQLIEAVPREQLFKDIQQRQLIKRVYIDETMHHTNT